jgi:hypothetical protein
MATIQEREKMKRGILLVIFISLCFSAAACTSKFQRPESTCLEGDCENGYGKMLMIDGRLYEGQFLDGKWHGTGKLTVDHEMVFEGEFKEGVYAEIEIEDDPGEPGKPEFEETDIWHRGWRKVKSWVWFD